MEFIDELRNLKEQLKFKGRFDMPDGIENIVVAGLGGSGITGRIFQEMYTKKPVFVVNEYVIPDFLTKKSMFIGISHSGNTEETLAATQAAIKSKAHVVTMSSGGALEKYGDQHVALPGKELNPRSAIGYMLMPMLLSFGLVNDNEIEMAYSLLSKLDSGHEECKAHAKRIVDGKMTPVIYGAWPFGSVAYRWKTQFNENAKILAYSGAFPEVNHNDTVALAQTYKKESLYFLVFGSDRERITTRIRESASLTSTSFNIIAQKGGSIAERLFYLIHYGDYVSYHTGLFRKVNPSDVSLIEEFKKKVKKN